MMAEEERFELSDGFPSAVFKTAALSHSAILPWGAIMLKNEEPVYPYMQKNPIFLSACSTFVHHTGPAAEYCCYCDGN